MSWSAAVTAIVEALDAAGQMGFNYQQADKNRKLAKYRHSYEVQDMRAAGLNPILSVSGGAGAGGVGSTPSPNIGNAVNSALSAKALEEQIKLLSAQAGKTRTEDRLLQKNVPLADAQKKVLEKTLTPMVNSAKANFVGQGESLIPKMIDKVVNSAKAIPEKSKNIFNKVKGILNKYGGPK